jgi:hypothetical protein
LIDAERERNVKLVEEVQRLEEELAQAKLELKLERQNKFATNQQKIIQELYGITFTPAALIGFETMSADNAELVVDDIAKKLASKDLSRFFAASLCMPLARTTPASYHIANTRWDFRSEYVRCCAVRNSSTALRIGSMSTTRNFRHPYCLSSTIRRDRRPPSPACRPPEDLDNRTKLLPTV